MTIKICDIIFPGFQAVGDAICYVFQALTVLKTM